MKVPMKVMIKLFYFDLLTIALRVSVNIILNVYIVLQKSWTSLIFDEHQQQKNLLFAIVKGTSHLNEESIQVLIPH